MSDMPLHAEPDRPALEAQDSIVSQRFDPFYDFAQCQNRCFDGPEVVRDVEKRQEEYRETQQLDYRPRSARSVEKQENAHLSADVIENESYKRRQIHANVSARFIFGIAETSKRSFGDLRAPKQFGAKNWE